MLDFIKKLIFRIQMYQNEILFALDFTYSLISLLILIFG
jgi:hypothetical protein